MEIIHKIDLTSTEQENIKITKNDINVHKFLLTIPAFIDLESVDVLVNIQDIFGNCTVVNDIKKLDKKIEYTIDRFFKTTGTRNCEVVFFNDNQIYHSNKFSYYTDYNLDCDCSVEETEQYPILLELLEKVKKQLEETGALNSEVQDLIDDIEDKLAKGEFDGRSVDFKIDEYKVGFKYSDEEEYQWVDLEAKIPADVMKEIEKIKHKADISYVDGQVVTLREELATKESLANTEQTLQDNIDLKVDKTIYEDNNIKLNQKIDLKADKTEIPAKLSQLENDTEFITQEDVIEYDDSEIKSSIKNIELIKADKTEIPEKLSELENDTEFITQDDVIEYDDTKLKIEINTLKETKANKSEVPTKNSQLINDSKFITLQEVPRFDDSDIKNSISQLEQNKANLVHTHVSSEIKHNTTTLDKELNDINANIKLKANKSEIPEKLSQLANDKGFITEADIDLTEVNSKIDSLEKNKADKTHEHSSNDISVDDKTLTETLKTINNTLDNKANNSELKTNLSEFENDSKFTTLDEVNQSDTIKNINIEVAKKVDKSEKGKADGVVPLNKNSKIALEYLPDLSKQQTHVIEAVEDMQKLENLLAGDKVFVVSSGDSYIWSGIDWKVLSKAEWENINLDWANIINNPLTSDDLVNIPKIPTKADKTDLDEVKKDISNNRSKWEKDTIYDDTTIKNTITKKADTAYVDTELSKKVNVVDGKGLSTNDYTTADKNEVTKIKDKADKSALNAIVTQIADNKELWEKDTIYDDSGIKADIAKKVDKIEGKQLSTNDYTTAEKTEVAKIKTKADKTYVDSELKNKASNAEVNSIIKDIDDNRAKWEKDTIYDDTGLKNSIKAKADKIEILSLHLQENEPLNMKNGDQWHQIIK